MFPLNRRDTMGLDSCFGIHYPRGMLLSFLKKLFDSNERELRRIKPVVEAGKRPGSKDRRTERPRARPPRRKSLGSEPRAVKKADAMMVEAFAVVREASSRILDMRPFDCQVAGAVGPPRRAHCRDADRRG
ncbi:MAG: hypothetical protein ACOX4B_04990 [Bacillota bacterium]